jgi:hypothetical protein
VITQKTTNSLVFVSPAGVNYDSALPFIFYGNQEANFSVTTTLSLFQFNSPVISSIQSSSSSFPTSGGVLLTIFGSNFAPPPFANFTSVAFGNYECVVISSTFSQIIFALAPGVGGPYFVKVTIGSRSTTFGVSYSYSPPVITSMSIQSGLTVGGEFLTIVGSNFGAPELLANSSSTIFEVILRNSKVNLNVPLCSSTFAPENFITNITFFNHSTIVTTIPPGYGESLILIVRVSSLQTVDSTSFSYTYGNPAPVNIFYSNATTSGNFLVTIVGENFYPGITRVLQRKTGSQDVCITPVSSSFNSVYFISNVILIIADYIQSNC